MATVKPNPEKIHTIAPNLICHNSVQAIDFAFPPIEDVSQEELRRRQDDFFFRSAGHA